MWFVNLYNLLLSLLSLLPLTPYPSTLAFSSVTVLGLTSTVLLPPPSSSPSPPPSSSSSSPASSHPPASPFLFPLLTLGSLLSLFHLPFLALSRHSPLTPLLHHNPWQPLLSLSLLIGVLVAWTRECSCWGYGGKGGEEDGWEVVEDWGGGGEPGRMGGGGQVSGVVGRGGRGKKKMSEKYEALLSGSQLTVESDDEDQSAIF